jgi:hypothetical protein
MNEKPTKKLIKTIKDLEKVIEMAKSHNIDSLEIEGIKISIPKTLVPQGPITKVDARTQAEREEDELFSDKWNQAQ